MQSELYNILRAKFNHNPLARRRWLALLDRAAFGQRVVLRNDDGVDRSMLRQIYYVDGIRWPGLPLVNH